MDHLTVVTQYILQGAVFSLKIYLVTIVCAIPLGMLCAMGKLSRFRILHWVLEGYTWIFRGTPLLLQLFFVYYGMPALGIELSNVTAAYIAFIINYGAYFTEIFRGGIQSIDRGQYEAAKALGMNYRQTMRSIVIPQAIKVVLPPTGNEAVTLIKDTALCSVISISEILRNSKAMVSKYGTIEGFFIAAILYLLMTLVIIHVFRYIEKRFAYYH